jgi:copper homeostasis protein
MTQYIREACVGDILQAISAFENGADRIELCADLANAGTTPSYACIKIAKLKLSIPIFVIIRPRGGDFFYSDIELDVMKLDIENCKSLGIDGVVIGILKCQNNKISIDIDKTKELIHIAKPMKITFHMAFDLIDDKYEAIDQLIELGVDRILTKGCNTCAIDGKENIKQYINYANDRIIIMPGGGVNKMNYRELAEFTGAKELHGTKIV